MVIFQPDSNPDSSLFNASSIFHPSCFSDTAPHLHKQKKRKKVAQ